MKSLSKFGADARAADVDGRRLAGDDVGLLRLRLDGARDLGVDAHHLVGGDDDAALLDLRRGVGDVEPDDVRADRQAGEVVLALVVGQRRVLALRTLQDDRDAPERHAGVLVGHAARDAAGGLLRAGDSAGREQQRHPQGGCTTTNAVHLASLSLRRWVHGRVGVRRRYGAVKVTVAAAAIV